MARLGMMDNVVLAYLESKKGTTVSRLKELEKWDEVKELIFPCDCGGGDYVRITWDEADENHRFLWLEAYAQHNTLRDRIKGAWAVIRGKSYGYADIILTEETVQKLAKFFSLPGSG